MYTTGLVQTENTNTGLLGALIGGLLGVLGVAPTFGTSTPFCKATIEYSSDRFLILSDGNEA